MKINYDKETGVTISFDTNELKLALQVLKAIQTVAGQGFIREAIEDIEYDLKPKPLPFINHYHICERCFMEIDDRSDSYIHRIEGGKSWVHQKCPELKPRKD